MSRSYPDSFYSASANPRDVSPELSGNTEADVCVVGGGFTGLSTALHLLEKGFSVVLLEASRIGYGASGRNGGQLVHSYSRDIDFIERFFGKTRADAMGPMAFEGGDIIRRFISQYGIQCDLQEGGVFAACNNKQFRGFTEHKALWNKYGYDKLEIVGGTEARKYVGTDRYKGIMLDKGSAHVHPLNLCLGEANAIASLGGQIFENSPVLHVKQGEKVEVTTAKGSVTASFIVVATNAYLEGVEELQPQLTGKTMICGTQVITTEPLPESLRKEMLPQNYCVEDCNYLLDYFRFSADGRLIYGGDVTYGGREPAKIDAVIRPKMLKTFPQLESFRTDYAWSGDFLLTVVRLPQFGRVGNNIYYAQGYSGHGVTSSHLAGELLASAIQGQAERFDVFAGLPHAPFPGGRLMRVPYTALGAVYYDLRDKLGI